jgi:hypothetical protein
VVTALGSGTLFAGGVAANRVWRAPTAVPFQRSWVAQPSDRAGHPHPEGLDYSIWPSLIWAGPSLEIIIAE